MCKKFLSDTYTPPCPTSGAIPLTHFLNLKCVHLRACKRAPTGTSVYVCTHVRVRTLTCAYTCDRMRAPSVRWGEIRRTSRCDTPYHWSRYAVSLFGVPRTPSRKRGRFRQNFPAEVGLLAHTPGSAVHSTPSSPPETQKGKGESLQKDHFCFRSTQNGGFLVD